MYSLAIPDKLLSGPRGKSLMEFGPLDRLFRTLMVLSLLRSGWFARAPADNRFSESGTHFGGLNKWINEIRSKKT